MTAVFAAREHHPATAQRQAALRGGVVGNYVDQLHIFAPLLVLTPALPAVVGGGARVVTGSLVVLAMLLGRPVGALLFGPLGDRYGRTRTTAVAICGTAGCSAAIALTPTHEVIGAAALWWILALRFLGGVFVAGEYSAAIPLAMEWSSPQRQGLVSGAIMAMAPLAQATLGLAAWLLLRVDPQAYGAWGWRIPFLMSAAASIGLLVFYRRRVADHAPPAERRPGLGALLLGPHRHVFGQLFGLMTGLWLLTNMTVIALPARLHLPAAQLPAALAAAAVVQAAAMAAAGHLWTGLGSRRFFRIAGVTSAVFAPAVWLLTVGLHGLAAVALSAGLLQAVAVSAYGPIGAHLSNGFPAQIRSTGYGAAYSLSIVVPALHPFYLPWLGRTVGDRTAVIGLLVVGGLLVAACGRPAPVHD